MSNCSVKKMYGRGFANMLTFSFMHTLFTHFLTCRPFQHFFMFFIFLFNMLDLTVRPHLVKVSEKERKVRNKDEKDTGEEMTVTQG